MVLMILDDISLQVKTALQSIAGIELMGKDDTSLQVETPLQLINQSIIKDQSSKTLMKQGVARFKISYRCSVYINDGSITVVNYETGCIENLLGKTFTTIMN